MPQCAVVWCHNYSKKVNKRNSEVTYHRFPNDPSIKHKWILATGKYDWLPQKHDTICSDHFEPASFMKRSSICTRLYPDAIPTLKSHPMLNEMAKETAHVATSYQIPPAKRKKVNDTPCSSMTTHLEQTRYEPPLRLPEATDVIANVYVYLLNEYETLKKSLTTSCDLRPLADILQRTAKATGVTKRTVIRVLGERKKSQESMSEAAPEKRPKYVGPAEEDSSNESAEEDQPADGNNADDDKGSQTTQEEPQLVTLKIEFEEEHEEHSETVKNITSQDPAIPQSHESTTVVQHTSSCSAPSTLVEVKVEPPDEESTDREESSLHMNLFPSTQIKTEDTSREKTPHSTPAVQYTSSCSAPSALVEVKVEPPDEESSYRA